MNVVHRAKAREEPLTLKHHAAAEVEGGFGVVQIDQVLRYVATIMRIALGRVDEGLGRDGAAAAHVGGSRRFRGGEERKGGRTEVDDGCDEEDDPEHGGRGGEW